MIARRLAALDPDVGNVRRDQATPLASIDNGTRLLSLMCRMWVKLGTHAVAQLTHC